MLLRTAVCRIGVFSIKAADAWESLIPCRPHQSWYHVYSMQLMLQFYWEMLHVKKWVYSQKMAADALESPGPCVPYKAETASF